MFPMYLNYAEILNPLKTLLYARKSRTDDPSLTLEEVLERHEIRIDEWCEQNLGTKIPEENRFREVVSGEKISERPEFNKVLRLIENPQYNAIICFDIARLSRGDLEDAGRLIKLLRYTSTYIITVSPFEFYDLSVERDRELFERALKRGNEYLEYFKKVSNNGRLISVSQGNYIGSVAPYGYNKTTIIEEKRKCPTLEINEEQANVVRIIFDLYVNKNMGRNNICKYLNDMNIKPLKGNYWSPETIASMLDNIHYIGKVRWNRKKGVTIVENGEIKTIRPISREGDYLIYEGKHEPIISEEMFYAAREKKGKCHRAKTSTKLRNPLAGLLYCKCGRAMEYKPAPPVGNKQPRLACKGQVRCGTGSILYDEMIEKVCDILKQSITDFEIQLSQNNDDSVKLHNKLINNLEAKLKALEEKELVQWEQQSHPDPTQRMPAEIFKKLNERLLVEKEETKQALITAKESAPNPINYSEKIQRFSAALDALKNPDVDAEAKNALLKTCIEKIIYTRERPERLKSQKIRYHDNERKITWEKSPLKQGGNYTSPVVQLEIRLKV